MDNSYCVKCGKKGPLVDVVVGNESDPVEVSMSLCWDCFNENFYKNKKDSVYYLYEVNEERDLDSDDEFDNTFEGN